MNTARGVGLWIVRTESTGLENDPKLRIHTYQSVTRPRIVPAEHLRMHCFRRRLVMSINPTNPTVLQSTTQQHHRSPARKVFTHLGSDV